MGPRTRASASHHDSSDAGTANARTVESRRSHRKSRNGCAECKRRHIRCNERQPSCANCEIAERACVFLPPKKRQKRKPGQQLGAEQQPGPETTAASPPGSKQSGANDINNSADAGADVKYSQTPVPAPRHDDLGLEADHHRIPSSTSSIQLVNTHGLQPSNFHPGLSSILSAESEAKFTPQHMILLHHAYTVPNLTGPNRSAVDIAVRRAVDSPYLLDEVLAFTAFHMIHLYPGSAICLQHLATELQTRALACFARLTESVPKDDKATAVHRFLFSAILGRHVLADTLAHYRSDFHSFIDQLVECFNLNRGIMSVTPPAQDYLHDYKIQPFLNVVLQAQNKISSAGSECDPLTRLLDDSDLSEASAGACRRTIKLLQRSFDICRNLDEENYPQSASVFSVRVEAGFVDMLRKHRPSALVILAYYGVLLHRCRGFWAFGDAGASMIRAIAGHLGSYWQGALAWPLLVLETEQAAQESTINILPTSRCIRLVAHVPPLVLAYHRLAGDGSTTENLVAELSQLYSGEAALPPVPQYADFAIKQRDLLSSGAMDASVAYWTGLYTPLPATLPLLPLPSAKSTRGPVSWDQHTAMSRLSAVLAFRIRERSKKLRTTPMTFYLAAYAALISELSKQAQVSIGLADTNRSSVAELSTMGYFANLLPLRLTSSDTFTATVESTKEAVRQAMAHSVVPHDLISSRLGLDRVSPREMTHAPLFQAVFDYRQGAAESGAIGGASIVEVLASRERTPYDVVLAISDDPTKDPLVLVKLQSSVYGEGDAEVSLGRYVELLTGLSKGQVV